MELLSSKRVKNCNHRLQQLVLKINMASSRNRLGYKNLLRQGALGREVIIPRSTLDSRRRRTNNQPSEYIVNTAFIDYIVQYSVIQIIQFCSKLDNSQVETMIAEHQAYESQSDNHVLPISASVINGDRCIEPTPIDCVSSVGSSNWEDDTSLSGDDESLGSQHTQEDHEVQPNDYGEEVFGSRLLCCQ